MFGSLATGALIVSISSSNATDMEEQIKELEMNSNNDMNSSVEEDYANFNKSTISQCPVTSIQGFAENTLNNDSVHGSNIHNDNVDIDISSNILQQEFHSNGHITRDIDNANKNPVDLSNSELHLYDDQHKILPIQSEQNMNLETNCYVPPFAEDLIEPFQSELHIDIGSDDTMHSWRPNLNVSPDCSFFMPHHLPSSNMNVENGKVLKTIQENDSQSSLESYWEEASKAPVPQVHLPVPTLDNYCGINIDLQSQLHCQKVQLNFMKYELAKTKLELHKWREGTQDLEKELKERLSFPNIHEIMLLNDENAKLRSECQILCTEVDYYLKEKAPLGEVDVDFYKAHGLLKKKGKPNSSKKDNAKPIPTTAAEESIDPNPWECSKCTFANHPEINSCELCHSPRDTLGHSRHCTSSNAACYCHPGEGSLPISS